MTSSYEDHFRVAVDLSNGKDAALYFDWIVPNPLFFYEATGARAVLAASKTVNDPIAHLLIDWLQQVAPVLPPDLDMADFKSMSKRYMVGKLVFDMIEVAKKEENRSVFQEMLLSTGSEMSVDEYENKLNNTFGIIRKDIAQHVVRACDLLGESVPIVLTGDNSPDHDLGGGVLGVQLAQCQLVDTSRASWDQVLEFRKDPDSVSRLRRLKLFMYEDHSGKSQIHLEDELLARIQEYEDAAKGWGFELRNTALESLFSLEFGLPAGILTAAQVMTGAANPAALITMGGFFVGKTAVKVRQIAHEKKKIVDASPVSYVIKARETLES